MKSQRKNKRMIALSAVALGLLSLSTGCGDNKITGPTSRDVPEAADPVPASVDMFLKLTGIDGEASAAPEIPDRYGKCDPKKEFKWDIPGNVEL